LANLLEKKNELFYGPGPPFPGFWALLVPWIRISRCTKTAVAATFLEPIEAKKGENHVFLPFSGFRRCLKATTDPPLFFFRNQPFWDLFGVIFGIFGPFYAFLGPQQSPSSGGRGGLSEVENRILARFVDF